MSDAVVELASVELLCGVDGVYGMPDAVVVASTAEERTGGGWEVK